MGGSNGGTLVGACVTQRPNLYGAAICQVPVMDMLKFHKFTIGHAWVSDFGNPDIEDEADCIIKWSPLHNIKRFEAENNKKHWPSLLVLTADHDDRVVPLHALKFIAQAQEIIARSGRSGSEGDSYESPDVILARVDVKAGHGAGKSTSQRIAETADTFAFVAKSLGLT